MTKTQNIPADPKRWWVLIGIGLAAILVAIDFQIVNICLPTIQHYFSVSTNTLQWLMLGFGITYASCMAAAGKLADIMGRRKVLYIGVVIFIIASLGAGFATNIHFLITMRLLQGLASASIIPCGMAIIASTFPASEKSKILGIYGSFLGMGLAIGPILGGFIVSLWSWQWIFFINVPLSIIALLICVFLGQLKESKHPEAPPINWLGIFSLILTIAGFCFIISQGGHFGWGSLITIISAIITILAFISLIIDIKTHAYPIIPGNFLVNKAFLLGAAIYISSVSVSWVVSFYLALYLRLVAGFNISQASLWFSIMTVMVVLLPTIAGHLYSKYSQSLVAHSSFLARIVGLSLLAFFIPHTSMWLMVTAFVITGVAWGAGSGIAMRIGFLSQKGHADAGVVSGAMLTIVNVFGTLFVAIATKIFTLKEASTLFQHLKAEHISLNANQIHHIKAWLSDPEKTKALIASTGHPTADKAMALFHSSFMSGFSLVFALFTVLVVVLYGLSMKNIRVILDRQ